jgi:mannose-6-phosphate isomerase-like protein (cupin superfamily)
VEYEAVNLEEKFARFSEFWSPRIIAQMNDVHLKLVRVQGEFVWHDHAETDEVFIVLEGEMAIEFRNGRVGLEAGELFVVPKGMEHRPVADRECKIMLLEPTGTVNTGEVGGELTAGEGVWV